MNDIITQAGILIREEFGAAAVFLCAVACLFVVTALLALAEHKTRRYREYYAATDDVPFHRNFSTLVDFVALNPLMVAVVVCSTQAMRELPGALEGKVDYQAAALDKLNETYLAWLDSPWIFPIGLLVSLLAWFFYLGKSFGGDKLKQVLARLPLTEAYIGICTALSMFFAVTFVWRTGIMLWYAASVTASGLVMDELEWSLALGSVTTVLSGINGFFAILGAIVLVMGIHDYRIHTRSLQGRRTRVKYIGIVVLLALCAAIMPIYTIHEHLAFSKERKIGELMKARSALSGDERAMTEEEIKNVLGLNDWVVGNTGGALAVSWQLLLLVGAAVAQVIPDRFFGKSGSGSS